MFRLGYIKIGWPNEILGRPLKIYCEPGCLLCNTIKKIRHVGYENFMEMSRSKHKTLKPCDKLQCPMS